MWVRIILLKNQLTFLTIIRSLNFVLLWSTNKTSILMPINIGNSVLQACQLNKKKNLYTSTTRSSSSLKCYLIGITMVKKKKNWRVPWTKPILREKQPAQQPFPFLARCIDLLIQWQSGTTIEEEDLIKSTVTIFIDTAFSNSAWPNIVYLQWGFVSQVEEPC